MAKRVLALIGTWTRFNRFYLSILAIRYFGNEHARIVRGLESSVARKLFVGARAWVVSRWVHSVLNADAVLKHFPCLIRFIEISRGCPALLVIEVRTIAGWSDGVEATARVYIRPDPPRWNASCLRLHLVYLSLMNSSQVLLARLV